MSRKYIHKTHRLSLFSNQQVYSDCLYYSVKFNVIILKGYDTRIYDFKFIYFDRDACKITFRCLFHKAFLVEINYINNIKYQTNRSIHQFLYNVQ